MKPTSTRRRSLMRRTGLTAIAVLALAACGNQATTTGGSVNVALNTSLSGSFGFFGLANQNAMKLAVEQINNKGGLLGKQVNLTIKDDVGRCHSETTGSSRTSSTGAHMTGAHKEARALTELRPANDWFSRTLS